MTGGGFGLTYAAMNATDVRSELGARFDDPMLLYGKPLHPVRARGLGARLGEQSCARRGLSGAAWGKFHRQWSAHPAELGAHLCWRRAVAQFQLVGQCQIRKRICIGLAYLGRLRHPAV